MSGDLLTALPSRRGHFLLESGYHTDAWLTLDGLFTDPVRVAPLIGALAERLRPYGPAAVCGPLVGGAFLAQAIATTLGARFYYTEPSAAPGRGALFAAEYRLPRASSRDVRGQRIAVVDDAISAGSSVRASAAALTAAGASVVVVAAFVALGDKAVDHFAARAIPMEALERRRFDLWEPSDCPLCRSGPPLEEPR